MQQGEAQDRKQLRNSLLKLAWPVIAEQVLATLASMVDMAIVGRLGAVAITAIGLTVQPLWLMVGLFMGLATGINALIARSFGAGDLGGARRGSHTAFWLGLLAAALAGIVVWYAADLVALLMGAEADVAPQAAIYLRSMVPGLVVLWWSIALTAALRAVGDTKTPFYINVAINLLNVPLTLVMVHGYLGLPALGVLGAGLSTSFARLIGFAILLVLVVRRFGGVGRPDSALTLRIMRVALPASFERMSTTVGYLLYARMIAGLGTVSFAAHHVTVMAENIVWMFSSGVAMGTSVMVGQALGARKPDKAYGAVREAAWLTVFVVGPLALAFLFLARPYLTLFTTDLAVIAAAIPALRIGSVIEVPMALQLVLVSAFQGAGDTRPLIWLTLVGNGARLAATFLFVFVLGWGLSGAWLATWCDWGLRLLLCLRRFRAGTWKEVAV